jgi:hypothetical protein
MRKTSHGVGACVHSSASNEASRTRDDQQWPQGSTAHINHLCDAKVNDLQVQVVAVRRVVLRDEDMQQRAAAAGRLGSLVHRIHLLHTQRRTAPLQLQMREPPRAADDIRATCSASKRKNSAAQWRGWNDAERHHTTTP